MTLAHLSHIFGVILIKMGYMANSEEPDDMQHNETFHQSLHFLLRQNQSSEKEMQYFLRNYNL